MIFRLGIRARLQQPITLCNVPDGAGEGQWASVPIQVTLRYLEGAELRPLLLQARRPAGPGNESGVGRLRKIRVSCVYGAPHMSFTRTHDSTAATTLAWPVGPI